MGVDLGKGSATGGEDPGARAPGSASGHGQRPVASAPAEPTQPTGPTGPGASTGPSGSTLAQRPTGSVVARTSPPPAPYRPREPAPVPQQQQEQGGGGGWSPQSLGLLGAAWTTGWIIAFANGVWWLGLAMLMLGGPLLGYLRQAGGGRGC
ncbi:hypothetical protein GTQ99_17445, partial [Kineococcus sp. T13]|nr:hypothetical protein [Kineococcus vitellinus]